MSRIWFQYRKRYEITCDYGKCNYEEQLERGFQYRKRYEITCDYELLREKRAEQGVSIPQAV